MRGFLVGTLALIVLYAVVQPNSAKAVTAGSNAVSAGLRRALSPAAAGVPQRKASPAPAAPAPATGGQQWPGTVAVGPGSLGRGVLA